MKQKEYEWERGCLCACIELFQQTAVERKLQIVDAGPLNLDGSIKASEAYRI